MCKSAILCMKKDYFWLQYIFPTLESSYKFQHISPGGEKKRKKSLHLHILTHHLEAIIAFTINAFLVALYSCCISQRGKKDIL